MTPAKRLTSADNPRIKAVVRLVREQRARRESGLFVAEGRRQVERAVAAGLTLREWYYCPELAGEETDPTLPPDLGITVTEALMRKMAYREHPEALLAVFVQPQWSLWEPTWLGPRPLLLVAMGTSKPGNLGAMARSAAAAGATAVLVADAPVDAFNPNAIHASTGAVFTLPVVGGRSEEVIAFLESHGIPLVAAVVGASQLYTQVDLTAPAALVIGAEDRGLDERWVQAAKKLGVCVSIPMAKGAVDSLNASNAAAILLYEAVRQRA